MACKHDLDCNCETEPKMNWPSACANIVGWMCFAAIVIWGPCFKHP